MARQVEMQIGNGYMPDHGIVALQRLAARGLHVRVADPIRILALTINPYAPEDLCTPRQMLDALLRVLPEGHPPVLDVVSGIISPF